MNPVCWTPTPERLRDATVTRFIQLVRSELDPSVFDYPGLYDFSLRDPEAFWRAVWEFFEVRGEFGGQVLADHEMAPGARWFQGSTLNFAENLLRRRDDATAIIFCSEAGFSRELSFAELYRQVAATAAGLKSAGVEPGDRVAAYLPNLPETVIAMLATASIGATWSSCSPDFGTRGVVDRFGQIRPRVLFATDAYRYNGKRYDCVERVHEIRAAIDSIERIVFVPYLDETVDTGGIEQAVRWDAFSGDDETDIDFAALPFDHPLYILYSSGTTGAPKCITHGAGGTLLQHLKELGLHSDVQAGDRFCYFTTCGWMMWNWLVSGLALGATLVLYEGSPFHPSPGAMFDLVDEHGVNVLGTGAKMIASWEKAGVKPRDTHDLSSLRTLLSTGSPLAPASFDYVYRDIGQDLCLSSIAGGTDIVSCFVGGCPLLPVRRGEIQCAGLGMKVEVRRDDGSIADSGEAGELCCSMPFPSMPLFFWGDEDGSRYRAAYFDRFEGTWAHGDYILQTENRGFVIFGRSDATLNPGGVRIGTAEIYRQVEKLDEVMESICIGQDWEDDVRVVLFVRLRDGIRLDEPLEQKIRGAIRANTTPRHVPAKILQVEDIPRTVSGKIVELAVRNVVMNRPVKNVSALANPEALDLYRDLPELQT